MPSVRLWAGAIADPTVSGAERGGISIGSADYVDVGRAKLTYPYLNRAAHPTRAFCSATGLTYRTNAITTAVTATAAAATLIPIAARAFRTVAS